MNPLRQNTSLPSRTSGCAAHEVCTQHLTPCQTTDSGQLMEVVLANIPGIIYRAAITPHRSIHWLAVSDGIRDLAELSPEDVITPKGELLRNAHSHRFYAMMHPEDRATFGAALERSLTTLHPFYHEYRLITPSGAVKWVADRARLSLTQDGTVLFDGVCLELESQPFLERAGSLLEGEQRRREWQDFLNGLSQRIQPTQPLQDILWLLVQEVLSFLRVERLVIFQVAPSNTLIPIAEATASRWPSGLEQEVNPLWFQESWEQLCQGAPLVVEDVDNLPAFDSLRQTLQKQQVKAGLILPILTSEGLWGVLCIHECTIPRLWSLIDIDFLKQLTVQIGVAIQHTELHHQLQRLNSELERKFQARTAQLELAFGFEATLKRITDKVRDSLDEDQILQTAVQELAIAIGVSGCNAALYDLEQGTSTICYEYTTTVSPSQGRVAHMKAFPELYGQLFRGLSFQFCSVVPNPVRGHVAMLTCPILDDQGVLGDLWLINHKFYAFSEQDIRLVQQVANQCAIALRQARLYKAAQAQVAELERLNLLKDDFLSRVSHELRTPIASIKMASQMLEVSLGKAGLLDTQTSPFARYLQILQGECQREMTLVNDLLDLSRLEAQSEPLRITSMPLQDWISELVEPFVERFERQRQQIQVNIPPGMVSVISDFSKLSRILTELLQNACKYTPSGKQIIVSAAVLSGAEEGWTGGMEPDASRETRPSLNHSASSRCMFLTQPSFSPSSAPVVLMLSVSNEGVEIPEQERSRIFEKFYRIPNTQDPWRHGGTGLGLALVKKLVEQMKGQVRVSSEHEMTTFTVRIPLSLP